MKGTLEAASARSCAMIFSAAHVGAERFGDVGWHRQVQIAHHVCEGGAIAPLQPWIVGELRSMLEWLRPLYSCAGKTFSCGSRRRRR